MDDEYLVSNMCNDGRFDYIQIDEAVCIVV